MKVIIRKDCCVVRREKGENIPTCNVGAKGESLLLHKIKKILNARGYDLIKKRMWRDGHLMDDMQQYLRTRKPTGHPARDIYIYSGFWAIEGADAALKRDGEVTLRLMRDVYNVK
jgi:hypothetical protein